jgi:hypothetical protein
MFILQRVQIEVKLLLLKHICHMSPQCNKLLLIRVRHSPKDFLPLLGAHLFCNWSIYLLLKNNSHHWPRSLPVMGFYQQPIHQRM